MSVKAGPLRTAWCSGRAGRQAGTLVNGADSRDLCLIYTPLDNAQYFMFRRNVGADSKHLSLRGDS